VQNEAVDELTSSRRSMRWRSWAATGCFNGAYYATAETQLDELRKLIDQVDDNVSWPSWRSTHAAGPS